MSSSAAWARQRCRLVPALPCPAAASVGRSACCRVDIALAEPPPHILLTQGSSPSSFCDGSLPLPLQLDKSLWEVVNLLQEQKRRRALLLGFSRSPVDFIQSMVATQGRELRSLKLNQYTELEAVRCAGYGCSACSQNCLAWPQLQQAACAFLHAAAAGCCSHQCGLRPCSIKLTSSPHQAVGWKGDSVGSSTLRLCLAMRVLLRAPPADHSCGACVDFDTQVHRLPPLIGRLPGVAALAQTASAPPLQRSSAAAGSLALTCCSIGSLSFFLIVWPATRCHQQAGARTLRLGDEELQQRTPTRGL